MKYRIEHYYTWSNPAKLDNPPVPEATLTSGGWWEVEIEDMRAFVEKHGPIQLIPPGFRPHNDDWFIWVTDGSGKFNQK